MGSKAGPSRRAQHLGVTTARQDKHLDAPKPSTTAFLGVKPSFIDQNPQIVGYIWGHGVEQARRDAPDLENVKPMLYYVLHCSWHDLQKQIYK